MMNIFKSLPAGIQLMREFRRYNKMAPEFEQLRSEKRYEEERELILKGTGTFLDSLQSKWHLKYDVKGEENIPDQGPVLIVSNHQGYADILMMYWAIRKFQIGFIAKSEFQGFKPLDRCINYTRSIYIDRGDARSAIQTLNTASQMMKDGFSLVIFPEGTRSKGHEMGEFKPGSFKFAQKAKVPILPVTLDGSYHVFEEKGSFNNKEPLHVRIHPLVHYEQMSRKEQNEAHLTVEQTIRDGLREFD